jgi:hypothetical protein
MDPKTPAFQPIAPPAPLAPDHKVALESMIEQAQRCADTLATTRAELAAAKAILKDLVAAGVLTDGFMTNAVGQCLLNQAEAAKKFLQEHP